MIAFTLIIQPKEIKIRKRIPSVIKVFKDKSKYSRKIKHKGAIYD